MNLRRQYEMSAWYLRSLVWSRLRLRLFWQLELVSWGCLWLRLVQRRWAWSWKACINLGISYADIFDDQPIKCPIRLLHSVCIVVRSRNLTLYRIKCTTSLSDLSKMTLARVPRVCCLICNWPLSSGMWEKSFQLLKGHLSDVLSQRGWCTCNFKACVHRITSQ